MCMEPAIQVKHTWFSRWCHLQQRQKALKVWNVNLHSSLWMACKTLFFFAVRTKTHRDTKLFRFVSWNYKTFVSDLESKVSGTETGHNEDKKKTNHSKTKLSFASKAVSVLVLVLLIWTEFCRHPTMWEWAGGGVRFLVITVFLIQSCQFRWHRLQN
jgi:hypothetical protein